ncbi:MAG TPA: putative S-layer protein [Candidatus Nanoarchaeia archaeon]|nr:putative S-layer protein [Candidatus Nanoarchaeia archaeon]
MQKKIIKTKHLNSGVITKLQHKMTYTYKLLVALFSIVIAVASVSALSFTPATITTNATHNTDVTISFNLTNDGQTNYTALNWALSTTPVSSWSWKTLPSQTTINNESITLSAVLTVPKYTAPGPYTALIKVKEGTGSILETLTVNINVLSSPALSLIKTKEITSSQNGTLNITNTGNTPLNSIMLTSAGALDISFAENDFSLQSGASKLVNVSGTVQANTFGFQSVTVQASVTANSVNSNTVTFTLDKSFCRNGPRGTNLSITNVKIENSGERDTEWKPLDRVTVEVEVENIGDDDLDEIMVELGLFDTSNRNKVNDLDFSTNDEEKLELGDLNDGDEETVTFEFIVPADFDQGSYKLAVKAFSDDSGESVVCTDSSSDLDNTIFESIDVNEEDEEGRFIAFDDIRINPEEATCGDTVELTTELFNIGEDDQDQVRARLSNRELGLSLEREIRDNVDRGDSKVITFSFTIPDNTSDKTYTLELNADYDYRNGNYRESSDESTRVSLKVFGCKPVVVTPSRVASISYTLGSTPEAGKQLVVKATVRNLADTPIAFAMNAKDYESWADLVSISERIITLDVDDTEEVTFTFNVNVDASGEQSFIIEAASGDKLETEEVMVTLPEKKSLSLGGNSLIWIIGGINLLLVILIIVVAVRLSQK